jgi:hypothetical protein
MSGLQTGVGLPHMSGRGNVLVRRVEDGRSDHAADECLQSSGGVK